MADKRYSLPARGPELNPDDPKIKLAWTVDKDSQIINARSTPSSGQNPWNIAGFCKQTGISLAPGEYEIVGDIDGAIDVNKLPPAIGDDGRRELTRAFGASLQNSARELSDLLAQFPTDAQIMNAAKGAVTNVLTANKPRVTNDEHGKPQLVWEPTSLTPGSLRVIGTNPSATYCEIKTSKVTEFPPDIPEELKSLLGRIGAHFGSPILGMDVRITSYPHMSFGDHAAVGLKNGPEGMVIEVGYIEPCDSAFVDYLNNQLAKRFAQAIALVEHDVVADSVNLNDQLANALFDQAEALAHAYNIDRIIFSED